MLPVTQLCILPVSQAFIEATCSAVASHLAASAYSAGRLHFAPGRAQAALKQRFNPVRRQREAAAEEEDGTAEGVTNPSSSG